MAPRIPSTLGSCPKIGQRDSRERCRTKWVGQAEGSWEEGEQCLTERELFLAKWESWLLLLLSLETTFLGMPWIERSNSHRMYFLDFFFNCIFASFLLPLPSLILDLHVWHHHNLSHLEGAGATFQAQ